MTAGREARRPVWQPRHLGLLVARRKSRAFPVPRFFLRHNPPPLSSPPPPVVTIRHTCLSPSLALPSNASLISRFTQGSV